jgi:hypothetical protein
VPDKKGIREFTSANRLWLESDFEIVISSKILVRDNGLELGDAEREIQRLVCQYRSGDITGVSDLQYQGQERLYGIDSN